jgi:hypothetical protein
VRKLSTGYKHFSQINFGQFIPSKEPQLVTLIVINHADFLGKAHNYHCTDECHSTFEAKEAYTDSTKQK